MYNGLPKFITNLIYYMLIYTHCWELMNSVGSHGSSSLLFVMKVMVCHFVSDSHEVMTALIVVLPSIVVVEISLQLHRSSIINQGGSWGAHNSWTWRQWQLCFLHHHGALDYDVILWPKMAKKRQEGGDSMWKNKTCLQILHDLKKRKIYVVNVVYTSPLSSITTCTHMTQSNVHTPHCTTPPSQWNILCQQV